MEIAKPELSELIDRQREFFYTERTLDIEFRMEMLNVLKTAIKKYESRIYEALSLDLGKHRFEAYATEVGMVYSEISHALKMLRYWICPKPAPTPLAHFPSVSFKIRSPYGVSLIMSPWNYPFQLTVSPLVGAIAGGNTAIVKPSAISQNVSAVISDMLGEFFSPDYIAVVTGGRKENETLLNNRFDKIFFTGSVAVGKAVMTAAARDLTPVTLELGGKSPCIVDETANIKLAAKRIVWGKFLNAGQTCVAPDYVIVHESVREELIRYIRGYIEKMYGRNPLDSPDLCKIISAKHFERLTALIDGHVVIGGESNALSQKIVPTVLAAAGWNHPSMQEEIFGPVLPVLSYRDLSEVIRTLKRKPKPLALYLFTDDDFVRKQVIRGLPFGGSCINDTVVHIATPYLPFGGIGESGQGAYHGYASFKAFTHEKGVLWKSNLIDLPLRYPPYRSKLYEKILKLVLK